MISAWKMSNPIPKHGFCRKINFGRVDGIFRKNTENVMKEMAEFIGIEYEPILASPSINGKVLNSDKHQIIGNINDDPSRCLSEADMDLLKYVVHGFNKQYSILKNISILLRAIKWRMLRRLVIRIGQLLKISLPRNSYLKIRKIYKERM